MKPLKDLGSLEGGCNGNVALFLERLGVEIEDMNPRERATYDVISQYRPARAKLRSADSEMLAFANSRGVLAQAAFDEGDHIGGLHILQTRASALGVAGDQPGQVDQLQQVWTQLSNPEDVLFLYSSTKSGLLENDSEFAGKIDLDEHRAYVLMLYGRRDPNYAGRAVALARRLVKQGYLEEALSLLEKAISTSDFSKEDQVIDAKAYLVELNPSDTVVGD